MQLKFLFGGVSHRSYVEQLRVADADVEVVYARNFRAKRYILRIQAHRKVRVTVPRRGNLEEAKEFLHRHIPWIQRHLPRAPQAEIVQDWQIGTTIYLRGQQVLIELDRSTQHESIRFGTECLPLGESTALRPRIERHLWRMAVRELPTRVAELAQAHGFSFSRVSVRNQRTRWGSASARGTISLNWRLIQAPPHVRDYIILHELCHGRHMNHSRSFWRLVEQVCPDYPVAEGWLKEHGRRLR